MKYADLDLISEFELIANKQSKLSKNEREEIVRLVAYEYRKKAIGKLVVFSVGNFLSWIEKTEKFEIQKEFKSSETWRGIVSRFISNNDAYYNSNDGYCKISPIEALAFSYSYFKMFKKPFSENGMKSMNAEGIDKLHSEISKLMNDAQEMAKSDKKMSKLISNNLIY